MANHVAVDLTKVAGMCAVNFNEAALKTFFTNDCVYEHWIRKVLEVDADLRDLAILKNGRGKNS